MFKGRMFGGATLFCWRFLVKTFTIATFLLLSDGQNVSGACTEGLYLRSRLGSSVYKKFEQSQLHPQLYGSQLGMLPPLKRPLHTVPLISKASPPNSGKNPFWFKKWKGAAVVGGTLLTTLLLTKTADVHAGGTGNQGDTRKLNSKTEELEELLQDRELSEKVFLEIRKEDFREQGDELKRINEELQGLQARDPEGSSIDTIKKRQELENKKKKILENMQDVDRSKKEVHLLSESHFDRITEKVHKPEKDVTAINPQTNSSSDTSFWQELKPYDPEDPKIGELLNALQMRQTLTSEQRTLRDQICRDFSREINGISELGDSQSPLVVLVGDTGSGKSTLADWLTNRNLGTIQDPQNKKQFVFNPSSAKSDASAGVLSKTTRPHLLVDDRNQLTYADCPGFNATQGTLQQIKNAIYIHTLFKNKGSVKFLIVAPIVSFKAESNRGTNFLRTLSGLKNMINPLCLDNISLAITHYDANVDMDVEDIQRHIKELTKLKEVQEDQRLRDLLDALSTSQDKIAFFSRPKQATTNYLNDKEKNRLREIVKKTKSMSLNLKRDVHFGLSEPAKLLVGSIEDDLTKSMHDMLAHVVTKRINKYYTDKIGAVKGKIVKEREEAMQHYSSYFFSWAQSADDAGGNDKSNTTKETKLQGITTRNISAGIAAAAAWLTPLGLMSVAALPLAHFIDKELWSVRMFERLKERHRKELGLELRTLARNLRAVKFGLFNGHLLTDSGILRNIDKNADVSEIIKTAKSLECIYTLNEKHPTDFARDVWYSSSLSTLEYNLRVVSHQNKEKFYDGQCTAPFLCEELAPSPRVSGIIGRKQASYPCRIGLSIDGGGIRGLIPALALDEIEVLSGRPISQLFDVVGGTSIGGILALGLVVPKTKGAIIPRHAAKDLVDLMRGEKGKYIFSLPSSSISNLIYRATGVSPQHRYSAGPLEETLKEYFGGTLLSSSLKPVIIAAHDDQMKSFIFGSRVVNAGKNPLSDTYDFFMRDVARATSAAPTYFPVATILARPVKAGNTPQEFELLDGGLWHNNPSKLVYDEMRSLYAKINSQRFFVISLGTGNGKLVHLPPNAGVQIAKPLIDSYMREIENQTNEKMWEAIGNQYIRVQPSLLGKEIELDNVSDENLRFMEERLEEHLRDLEEITRFLLINDDAWRSYGGRDHVS